MQKLILNSTQVPNYLLDEILPQLSGVEFKVLMIIARQTYGWHKEADRISASQLKRKTGTSNGSIGTALKSLREKEIIKVTNRLGKEIKTKEEAQQVQELYYRINATSPEIGDHLSNYWIGTSPEIGDTKETTTKTITNVIGGIAKKQTSCPLLNGSPLKTKYPNGHNECVEYLLDEESKRGFKFINLPKQYLAIHKILKAGYGFDKMDKTIHLVEKKYSEHSWDYMTLANWLEKGSGNG